jgi:hypothetical protein
VPLVTIFTGLLLTALGVWGYFIADVSPADKSVTALIPAFVGVPLVVLGILALKESMLKHAMHAAAMLGLLGFLAAAGRLVQKLVTTGMPSGVPGISVGLMILLCALFVALCVNSFVAARRRRRAAAGQTPAAVP